MTTDEEFLFTRGAAMVGDDGTTRRAMVKKAKKLVSKKSDHWNWTLDADWDFDWLKAEAKHSAKSKEIYNKQEIIRRNKRYFESKN